MARKRLNKKLVIGLTVFSFLTVVILSALMLRQLQTGDPQHLVTVAEQYAKKGEWTSAATFYQRAFAKSNDPAYLVPFGNAMLQAGEVRQALFAWEQALQSQPDLIECHLQKIDVLLELARLYGQPASWQQLLEAADGLLGVAQSSDSATDGSTDESAEEHLALAFHAKGLALTNLEAQDASYRETGLGLLQQASELAPAVASYTIDLARAYNRHGDIEERDAALAGLMQRTDLAGPDASLAHTTYAAFLAGQSLWDEARGHHRQSIDFAGDDREAILDAELALAGTVATQWIHALRDENAQADGFLDEAREILERATQTQPDSLAAYLQLAQLLKAARLHEETVQVCEDRLELGLSRRGLQAPRDRLRAFRLMILACESSVASAAAIRAEDDLETREEWLTKADRFIADANGEFPDHPQVLNLKGRINLTRGMDRLALELFKRADAAYGTASRINWDNKLLVVQMHLRLSEPGAALAVLKEVIDEKHGRHSKSFWSSLSQAYFELNDYGPALNHAIAQLELVDPGNVEARRLRAAVRERQGKLVEASELVSDSPSMVAMLKARRLAMDGDLPGAVGILQTAMETEPSDAQLVGAAVHALMRLGRQEEAQAVITRATTAKPDDRRLQKIAVLANPELSPDQRDQAMLEVIGSEQDGYRRAWELIAFYWVKEDSQKALEYIKQAEKHLDNKDTPAARSAAIAQRRELLKAKLRVAMQLDDQAALDAVRISAAKHNVDGANGRHFLGLYHLAKKEVNLAIQAFKDTLAVQPSHVESMTQLAQCYHRLGQDKEATAGYERALRINPNNGLAHKGLASLAKERGDDRRYQDHLRHAARIMPSDPWVQREVLIKQEQGNPQAAIARRVALLEDNPTDLANLRQLAQLSEKVKNLEEGDKYHRKLLDLQPDDGGQVAHTSGYFSRTGRPEKGLSLLVDFADSRTSDEQRANALLLVAGHHLAAGDLKMAESTLLQAADVNGSFDVLYSLGDFHLRNLRQPKEALAWFSKAAQVARESNSSRLAQALSSQIACLLFRNINDLDGARAAVKELKETFPDDPQGWLWESEVFARRGRLVDAIGALSAYLEKVPNEPYALFQRAQYLRGEGRTQSAIADLEAIKGVDALALDMEPRLFLAELYRQEGRKDAWLRELAAAATDAPDNARAIEQLVNAHIAEQQFAAADSLVTAQLNRGGAMPDGRWYLLSGRISLALQEYDEALADFKRGAAIDDFPADRMMMVLGVFLQAKKYEEGAAYYQANTKPEKRDAAVLARYARLLAAVGQDTESVQAFREAMELTMVNPAMSMGPVLGELRQAYEPKNAATLFEQIQPNDGLHHANDRLLVHIYQQAERDSDALSLLARLIPAAQLPGERASLLADRGVLYQAAGRTLEARQSYEEAIKFDANNWVLLNNVAYLLSDAEDKHQAALPYAQRAVDLANNAATLDTLGWIFVGLGQYDDAVADLSRAIRLDPDDPLAYYHLGEAHRRQRRFVEAGQTLDRGLGVAEAASNHEAADWIQASLAKVRNHDATP